MARPDEGSEEPVGESGKDRCRRNREEEAADTQHGHQLIWDPAHAQVEDTGRCQQQEVDSGSGRPQRRTGEHRAPTSDRRASSSSHS